MSHAIIRGKNGRRHELDFGDAPIRVEVYAWPSGAKWLGSACGVVGAMMIALKVIFGSRHR